MAYDLKMLTWIDIRDEIGVSIPGLKTAFLGGSRATVSPPPTDTDMDIFMHVDSLSEVWLTLEMNGWLGGLEEYDYETETFSTFRKGYHNLLVFEDYYEFGAVWGATCVAKSMNLKDKSDRYKLFKAARAPWRDYGQS